MIKKQEGKQWIANMNMGYKDGVTCLKCGLKLGVQEYHDFLQQKEVKEPKKPSSRRKGAK